MPLRPLCLGLSGSMWYVAPFSFSNLMGFYHSLSSISYHLSGRGCGLGFQASSHETCADLACTCFQSGHVSSYLAVRL